ncbi:AAA family ATPase [bacterium]|nr:AAA family ATPase [bacterium]
MSSNLQSFAMVAGFPSITSTNLAEVPEDCKVLNLKEGDRIRFSLNPSYKGSEPCIFVNLHHHHEEIATRAGEILYAARTKSDDNKAVFRIHRWSAGDISCLSGTAPANRSPLFDWIRLLICNWEFSVCSTASASGKDAAGSSVATFKVIGTKWDTLMEYVQPAKNRTRINSLPPSLYRSEAMRWAGRSGLNKKHECVNAIMDNVHCVSTQENGSPMAEGGCIVSPGASYYHNTVINSNAVATNVTPSTPAQPSPAPAATPKPEAPAPVPAMPSGGNLAEQIASLTQRADGFDAMQSKAESLQAEVLKLSDEVKELKARPQVTIKTGPTFTPSGGVDIAGTELPHFKLSPASPWSVPKINPQYKLNGWSASFSAGDLKVDYKLGQVVKSIHSGTPTRVIGRPATGKTSGIEQACAHMGVPIRVIQCGKGLTEFTLLGEQTIENCDVVWKDGILPALFKGAVVSDEARQTPHIVVLDEGDHLKAEIQSILHGVLEGGMLDLPNGEKVVVPENVIFVMTANTHGVGDLTGRHASAQVSDDAFISRWTRAYNVNYLDSDDEKNLLLSYGVPTNLIAPLMQFIEGTRKQSEMIDRGEISDGVRTPVTLRSLIPFAQDCANGVDPKAAFCATVMGGFSPDEYDKVRELIRATMDW